jgi:hypothetical protein
MWTQDFLAGDHWMRRRVRVSQGTVPIASSDLQNDGGAVDTRTAVVRRQSLSISRRWSR